MNMIIHIHMLPEEFIRLNGFDKEDIDDLPYFKKEVVKPPPTIDELLKKLDLNKQ